MAPPFLSLMRKSRGWLELEESESSDEDEEEKEEVVEETRRDEDFGHALILSTPYDEKDLIQPLHSNALPSNS